MVAEQDLSQLPQALREAVTGRKERPSGLWRLSLGLAVLPLGVFMAALGAVGTTHYVFQPENCTTLTATDGASHQLCQHSWKIPAAGRSRAQLAAGGFVVGSTLWLDRMWRLGRDDEDHVDDVRRDRSIRIGLAGASLLLTGITMLLAWPWWVGLLGLAVPLVNWAWLALAQRWAPATSNARRTA